jgi:hypothetical protein
VNSHSPVRLVSWQRDTVDCVTVAFTNILSTAVILLLGKARSRRELNLGCRGLTYWGGAMLWQKKSLRESCRMGRRSVVIKLICSLGHCECDSHTVHNLRQWCFTADWLASQDSYCLRMDGKVSFDWLPSYIKATRPVLEIFKMARYFPDSPRNKNTPNLPINVQLSLNTSLLLRTTSLTVIGCNQLYTSNRQHKHAQF